MKKLFLLTVACVMVAVGANAQGFEKNDWFARADFSNLSMTHAFSDDFSVTSADVKADVGYFISDKFAVEASLGFEYMKQKEVDGSTMLAFGVAARYYPVGNLFAYAGYSGTARKELHLSSAFGIAVGYDMFLSDKIFFEPTISYARGLSEAGQNNLGLGLGIGIKF